MGGNRIWARRAIVAGSCGVLVALAGCSAKTGATATGAKASTSTTTGGATSSATTGTKAKVTPAAGPLAALTGLPVSAAVAQRPAVAVAVSGSDPVGLASADVVFAEMASPARYLAVYQSSEANAVGPVSGTRPVDGPALSVLHPLIGYDGGTTSFLTVLHATKVIDASYAEHASLYSSGTSGLTVSTSALAGADSSDGPPPPLFSYRTPAAPLASTQETHPTSVRLNIPGQPAQQWNFDAHTDRWVLTSGGPKVSVANLIVQVVPFHTVYLSRKYGQSTQSAKVYGSGSVTVFSGTGPGGAGGTAATGLWDKPGLAAVTNYLDAAGTPMDFAPGPTWIVLAPAGTRASQAGGLAGHDAHRPAYPAGPGPRAGPGPPWPSGQPPPAVVRPPPGLDGHRAAGRLSGLVGAGPGRLFGHPAGHPDAAADAGLAAQRPPGQDPARVRPVAALPGLHGGRGLHPGPDRAGHGGIVAV